MNNWIQQLKAFLGKRAPEKDGQAPERGGRNGQASMAPETFVPANPLETQLLRAYHDPDYRQEFANILLGSTVCVICPEAPDTAADGTLPTGTEVSLLELTGPDGTQAIAAFTSEARVSEFVSEPTNLLKLTLRDLLAGIDAPGIVLNPGQPVQVHYSAEALRHMMGEPVPRTIDKDTKLLLGSPAKVPQELVAHMQTVLAGDPRIEEAWLALAQWPEHQAFSWYLDLRSTVDGEQLRETMAQAVRLSEQPEYPIDIVVKPVDGEAGNGIRLKPLSLH